MRIYVASSWRNQFQSTAVHLLRLSGFDVYDFKNPSEGDTGFHWSDVDPEWRGWSVSQFIRSLQHPAAIEGFNKDWFAMQQAHACLLIMPCGRSAHLEAGYFKGAGKPLIIYTTEAEPELMYKMADDIVEDLDSAVKHFRAIEKSLHSSKNLMSRVIKAPDCISDSGKHTITHCKNKAFYKECEHCGERFCLVSETVLQAMGVTEAQPRVPSPNRLDQSQEGGSNHV